jgi:hypothetical protein
LFAKQLLRAEQLSPAVRDAASRVYQENLARNLLLRDETDGWIEKLGAAGIPCRILKGVYSSMLLYDDPGAKVCADIDVLVAPGHLDGALAVAAAAGFAPMGAPPRAGDPHAHAVSLASADPAHPYQLDLHWRLDGALTAHVDEDAMSPGSGPSDSGHMLSTEMIGVLLYLHLWRHGLTLKTLVDFAAFVSRFDEHLPGLRRRLAQARVENGLRIALGLSRRVLGVSPRCLPVDYPIETRSGLLDLCLRTSSIERGPYFTWLVRPTQFDGITVTARRLAAQVFRSEGVGPRPGPLFRLARVGARIAFGRHRFIAREVDHEHSA